MQRRLGRLRLVAVLAVVVVSLTGFQTRVHKHSSGSGGGCSGSHSSSHSYPSDDDDDDYSSSGSSGSSTKPTARMVSCADADGNSVVVVDDTGGGRGGDYVVEVTFYDGDGTKVDTGTESVHVTPGETTTVVVGMDDPGLNDGSLTCKVTGLS